MTAIAKDRLTDWQEGEELPFAAGAAKTIYGGTFVLQDVASGYAESGTDATGKRFLGVSTGPCDNAAGVAGAKNVIVRRRGIHRFACTGLAITDIGEKVYLVDNQTVAKTSTNYIYVGRLAGFLSATVALVDIEPAVREAVAGLGQDEQDVLYGAAATESISGARLIVQDVASGYAESGTDATGKRFLGVSAAPCDNSAGAAGAKNVLVRRRGLHKFTASGLAITDIGCRVYLSNATTVAKTSTHYIYVGILVGFVSATVALVDIRPATAKALAGQEDLFWIYASRVGTVGAGAKKLATDLEFGRPFQALYIFAGAKVAPDTGYKCTVTVTDGTSPVTLEVSGTATSAEDKTLSQIYGGAANINITAADNNASATTEDLQVWVLCRWL